MSIKVLQAQSLADIALQYCGTLQALFDIAVLNGLSITQELEPGQELELPDTDYGFKEVVNYYRANKLEPATSDTVYAPAPDLNYLLPQTFPLL